MDPDRKARLAALRAEAAAAGEVADGGGEAAVAAAAPTDEPVLRFRNYAPAAEERIQHEKVRGVPVGRPAARGHWRHTATRCLGRLQQRRLRSGGSLHSSVVRFVPL